MPHPSRGRAIVLGASLAGLTSARVLSEFFEEVLVVERDPLRHAPEQRRHVPQSAHAHGMLGGGRNALCALFPGWIEDLRAHGAPTGPDQPELAEKVSYLLRGEHIIESPAWWLGGVAASRVLVEHVLRERVRGIPNVYFVEARATGLRGSRHIEGVETSSGPISGSFVVDASGRRSQLVAWFEALGHRAPPVTVVHSDVRYASCMIELDPAFDPPWLTLLGGDEVEGGARGIVILPIEHGRYHCTLTTVAHGERIPDRAEPYLAWGRRIGNSAVHEALLHARVVSEIGPYSVPSNRFIHYDRMRAHPQGVVAVGDAACAFNPVYGQGMSVAALSAVALQRELRSGRRDFARAIAAVARPAWSLAVAEDIRLGCRTAGVRGRAFYRLGDPYRDRLVRAASLDPELALAFNEVVHLMRSPSVLVSPRVIARVLRMRRLPKAAVPSTSPTRATRHLFEVPPLERIAPCSPPTST